MIPSNSARFLAIRALGMGQSLKYGLRATQPEFVDRLQGAECLSRSAEKTPRKRKFILKEDVVPDFSLWHSGQSDLPLADR